MAGVVLVVLHLPEDAPRLLTAAATLAGLAGAARIIALCPRLPPRETILPTEEILTAQQATRVRADERQRSDAVRARFEAWRAVAPAATIAAEWADVESRADHAVAEWGRRADYIVLRRPGERPDERTRQALHAALFDSARPVLLVPVETPPAPFGHRVAIAWRDDARTLRAVLAALRCLGGAERIHVLAGHRQDEAVPRLPDVLDEHGIAAELHVLPVTGQGRFGEVLAAKARELGCDMLVMGAFVRNPTLTLVFGGVTRYMLSHAEIPVLMRH